MSTQFNFPIILQELWTVLQTEKPKMSVYTYKKKRVQDLDTYINQPTLSLQLCRQLQVCCEWSVIRSTFDNHELWTTHLQINLTPVLHPSLFPYQMLGQFIIPYSCSAAHQHDERLYDMFHSAQSWLSHQSHWYPSQARTCNIICKVNHRKHKHQHCSMSCKRWSVVLICEKSGKFPVFALIKWNSELWSL